MLKVMLCAPHSDLDQSPEILDITSRHNVTLLTGVVTLRELYRICNEKKFDVLHFACHGDEDGLYLDANSNGVERNLKAIDGEHVSLVDLAQLVRACGAELVVLNACLTSAVAAYTVRHGAWYCIHALRKVKDADAWKVMLLLYDRMDNMDDRTIVNAFQHADDETNYTIAVAPRLLLFLLRTIDDLHADIEHLNLALTAGRLQITMTQRQVFVWVFLVLCVLSVTLIILNHFVRL